MYLSGNAPETSKNRRPVEPAVAKTGVFGTLGMGV